MKSTVHKNSPVFIGWLPINGSWQKPYVIYVRKSWYFRKRARIIRKMNYSTSLREGVYRCHYDDCYYRATVPVRGRWGLQGGEIDQRWKCNNCQLFSRRVGTDRTRIGLDWRKIFWVFSEEFREFRLFRMCLEEKVLISIINLKPKIHLLVKSEGKASLSGSINFRMKTLHDLKVLWFDSINYFRSFLIKYRCSRFTKA